jgi:hypothetical protein
MATNEEEFSANLTYTNLLMYWQKQIGRRRNQTIIDS